MPNKESLSSIQYEYYEIHKHLLKFLIYLKITPVHVGIFVYKYVHPLVGFMEARSVRCPSIGVTIGSELQVLCVSPGY